MTHASRIGASRLAWAALAAALFAGLALPGCSGSGKSEEDSLSIEGAVPIAYVKRVNTMGMNPTNGAPSAPGGDLMVKEMSSPSAKEHNLTEDITQGNGDASDPEVSYDGKKIIFSLKCPASNTSLVDGKPACTGRWNIWEYNMTEGGLTKGTFRRLTDSTTDDDVDPYYLPDGRGFVFSSNRQTKSKLNQALGRSYYALDEYERERVFNLHTMSAQGTNIQQISFNQSHDRNPVVRQNGDIMFSRWDHVGGRNHFKIFRMKPDGTDMFVIYGAHSEGNSFLHPREMDPNGQYGGFVSSDLMPLSRTHEGGGLMLVDVANYSEQNTPANASVPTEGGQSHATDQPLNLGGGLSRYGRVTTPFPLWDGTDRFLVAYRPCEVSRGTDVVSCATLTDDEMARLADENRSEADVAADEVQDNVPPPYAIYMFDPAKQTWLNVAAPPPGFMYTDPVPIVARTGPAVKDPTSVDAALAAQGLGLLEVRSVYDTDGLGRMGDAVLAAADLPEGCTTAIPKTSPTDSQDTRAQVADIARLKNPADAAYRCGPARFIRAVRAVAPPASMMGLREAIGETEFEPQQILGYAPIEPDGSFKLHMPADTPVLLAVVDEQGRAFQTHTNWIQVRPGERRTCDGCHSPRRGGALNSGTVADTMPSALRSALASQHQSGETMAGTRTRLDPNALKLVTDMVYTDEWADTTQSGVTARTPVSISYAALATTAPVNGVINYPDHIQPLWSRDRGANTCTNCHNAASGKLDLSPSIAGTGRLVSYEKLMLGEPMLDANGLPVTRLEEGVPVLQRLPALVFNMASEGGALGLARQSRLIEILSGQSLLAGADARTAHPTPPGTAPNHAGLLNAAEKRLVAEWIDLGGQYYNNPFDGANVRSVTALNVANFEARVYPILRAQCAGCHQAVGSNGSLTFRNNRFVLTGDAEGDFGVTLTMISNTCAPASNYLLQRPSTIPHPAAATGQTTAVLPTASANYQTIATWIATGCPTP
ncbi:MAG: hypothetical protein IV094_20375 [Vitreoscilla sp.]|nr:hypothetical protein [Vitreoscilla sp.]